MSQAPKMIPALAGAPASAASHSAKTASSAVSRSMSSLWPTAIRNMATSLHRLELVAFAIRCQTSDRRYRLVAQRDQPAVRRGAREQLTLDLDGIEREVVEGRDPARVRAPRPHPEVAEERQGSVGAADDDSLMALRMPTGRDDRDAG